MGMQSARARHIGKDGGSRRMQILHIPESLTHGSNANSVAFFPVLCDGNLIGMQMQCVVAHGVQEN
jgi:hypothetical protein